MYLHVQQNQRGKTIIPNLNWGKVTFSFSQYASLILLQVDHSSLGYLNHYFSNEHENFKRIFSLSHYSFKQENLLQP